MIRNAFRATAVLLLAVFSFMAVGAAPASATDEVGRRCQFNYDHYGHEVAMCVSMIRDSTYHRMRSHAIMSQTDGSNADYMTIKALHLVKDGTVVDAATTISGYFKIERYGNWKSCTPGHTWRADLGWTVKGPDGYVQGGTLRSATLTLNC